MLIGWFVALVLLLQLTSGVEPCDKRCPADGKDRFKFPSPNRSDILTWTNASDLCRQHGMTLPIITSPCEQYMFSSYLQDEGVYEYDVWLGGKTKTNHEWEWLNGSLLDNPQFRKSRILIYLITRRLIHFSQRSS